MENLSCCSSYVECSDQMKCLKTEFQDSCQYWKRNLSEGIVIYGKNRNIQDNSPIKKQEVNQTCHKDAEEQLSFF